MGKLPKIISLFLCIIFVFSGCTQKYDIVDHNDYSSALLEEDFSNGEFDFSSSDTQGTSSIVSYEELISGTISKEGSSSLTESGSSSKHTLSASTSSNITTKSPATTTGKPASSSKPATPTSKPSINNQTSSGYTPVYYSEMKAVWLSYYNFYYDIKYKNATTFRTYAKEMMQKIKNFGFNTVIVHLRSHGDAIYDSAYFPWSNIMDGKNPGYDPTQILIEEAHAQNLSFHAWFNPLRLDTPANLAKVSNSFQTKKWYNTKLGDYVVQSGSYCYLNPAYSEVRTLIINGAKEIAQKYKVDALHIDDYFYPTTAASFDSKAYASLGGGNTLAYFRRNNVNTLIRGIYKAVKGVNSKLKFGISPGGNVERNKNELYADTTTWLQYSGYMDYCIPQIYWGYNHKTHDYKKITNQWKSLATNNSVDLIIGLGFYKVNNSEYANDGGSNEWMTDHTIIARQVKDAKTLLGSKYKGFAVFDYEYLFDKNTTLHQKARDELKKVM